MTFFRNVFCKVNLGLVFAARGNVQQYHRRACRDAKAVFGKRGYKYKSLEDIKTINLKNDSFPKSSQSEETPAGLEEKLEGTAGLKEQPEVAFAGLQDQSEETPASPVHSKFNKELCDRVVQSMRTHPHGLAAVVAPSVFQPLPVKSRSHWSKAQRLGLLKDSPTATKSGMLISSLNSVAVQPVPYISFNINLPSKTYDRIRAFEEFMITGLNDATTAHAFLTKARFTERKDSKPRWAQFVDEEGRVRADCGGTWWMKCKVSEYSTRVANNRIVVAKVISAGLGGAQLLRGDSTAELPATGMVYLDGDYRFVKYRPRAEPETSPGPLQNDVHSIDCQNGELSDGS